MYKPALKKKENVHDIDPHKLIYITYFVPFYFLFNINTSPYDNFGCFYINFYNS